MSNTPTDHAESAQHFLRIAEEALESANRQLRQQHDEIVELKKDKARLDKVQDILLGTKEHSLNAFSGRSSAFRSGKYLVLEAIADGESEGNSVDAENVRTAIDHLFI